MKAGKNTVDAARAISTPVAEQTLIERIAGMSRAITLREFADMFVIDYTTAWLLAKNGTLPAMRVGMAWRLDPQTTARWLKKRMSPAA